MSQRLCSKSCATRSEKLGTAAVALFVYAVGFIASFFLPEPAQGDLPE